MKEIHEHSINDFTNDILGKIDERNPNAINNGNAATVGVRGFYGSYNRCKSKLEITQNELDFLNKNCSSNIVSIRNRVMHPKPVLFDDYAVMQNLFSKIDQYVHSIGWVM